MKLQLCKYDFLWHSKGLDLISGDPSLVLYHQSHCQFSFVVIVPNRLIFTVVTSSKKLSGFWGKMVDVMGIRTDSKTHYLTTIADILKYKIYELFICKDHACIKLWNVFIALSGLYLFVESHNSKLIYYSICEDKLHAFILQYRAVSSQ